jgi:hypothetical protein
MKNIKTYSELMTLQSFKERFLYLKLGGIVGEETFGFKRRINQEFYHSDRWLRFRDSIIIRDSGCDLGVPGFEIYGSVLIHHLNPITFDDIFYQEPCVFDPENVICTKLSTHNAIHYGDESLLVIGPIERKENDTCPWRKNERSIL